MTVTQEVTPLAGAFGLVDQALAEMAGSNIIETSKMTDILLDLRILLLDLHLVLENKPPLDGGRL